MSHDPELLENLSEGTEPCQGDCRDQEEYGIRVSMETWSFCGYVLARRVFRCVYIMNICYLVDVFPSSGLSRHFCIFALLFPFSKSLRSASKGLLREPFSSIDGIVRLGPMEKV